MISVSLKMPSVKAGLQLSSSLEAWCHQVGRDLSNSCIVELSLASSMFWAGMNASCAARRDAVSDVLADCAVKDVILADKRAISSMRACRQVVDISFDSRAFCTALVP